MEDIADSARRGVGIRAIGGYLPERVVTNAELEQSLDTTDAWIQEFIGVKTRRWSAPEEWTSDLGAAALLDACRRAGVGPESVDLVICGTYTPDHHIPATAVAIMGKLGIRDVPGFDVNSGGCPGGTFALDVGAKYVASGAYRRVAVVLADVNTKIFDPEDRTVGVIFGDGAACYLLEPTTADAGVGTTLLRSDPTGYTTAYVKREKRTWPDGSPKQSAFGDNFAHMHGRGVRDFALDRVPGFVEELVKTNHLALEDIDLIVFHQANYRLIHVLMERLGLPVDRTMTNVQKYGNTSGAGVPLVLREALDSGRIKAGSNVVIVSFGAGMSHGGTVIRWAAEEDFGPAA
ncbi:ketoacyl-ACP synthase III [Streptomyces sanglieri]|uniref:3-oxoacyl-ACP synthase III family protein n=1 Tax=Streptomyces sanglieri TaxID=193460 RepID=A0ABW2WZE6_9ACTN|nr:beta-ketoacyl-ACP synthase 3 [Streptomyces sp. Wh19]MDV9194749.1 beta-ketoacyl-ACP synthase 3 [Streptomyces sp. Wh19]